MRSICTFEPSAKGYSDLYETVLIDTPIGKCRPSDFLKSNCVLSMGWLGRYFSQFLEESSGGDRMEGTHEVRNVLEEIQMEIIKSSMLKLWLEDFYNFCLVII
ncbi:MAG: hypothetical protein RL713_784 [Bacteroidota bacterium]|jgi:V-type H+-transporting ATPase subunit d